jgi:N-acetylglucosaminyl-diphospho-decaprenol L-rhamnosyltransferase
MELTAVVVNWNSGPYLGRLLDCLADPSLAGLEIIVIDNDSHDGSLDCLAFHPGVRLLRFPGNRGFAGAANEGLRRASNPLVLLANPDIRLAASSLLQLHRQAGLHPEAAILSGRLTGEDGKEQSDFQLRPLPTPWRILTEATFLRGLARKFFSRPGKESGEPASGPLEVEQPAAACWLLRKQAWEELGGFDSRFSPAWYEDVDFCKRLQATPWKILYFPEIPIEHRRGLSLETLNSGRFHRIYYKNLLRYTQKHHPLAYPFLWLPIRSGGLLRSLLRRRPA